jgi:hypothetical protein
VTVALQADRIGREGAMAVRFTARIDVAWSPSLIVNTTQTPRIRGLDPKDGSTTRRPSGRTPWRGQLVARFNADIYLRLVEHRLHLPSEASRMAGSQRWYDLVPEISTARRLSEHHGDKGVRYALCEEHSLIAFNETVRYAIVDLGPRPRVRPHFFDLAGLLGVQRVAQALSRPFARRAPFV